MTETATRTAATARTLDVPGAVLTYDLRRNEASSHPVLLLIGSPMGAAGFGTLAGLFPERTVVTYDPRGVERSRRTDGASESTPEETTSTDSSQQWTPAPWTSSPAAVVR